MATFVEFYQNLRVKDSEPVRVEIEKMVSHNTVLNWKNGTFEPAGQWWSQINAIAEKYGYPKPYTL